MVHNETATGVTSHVEAVRQAIDRSGHPALFMVDTISSLASIDYRHDEWGVDVGVASSQKGLMLPAGLSVNANGAKALAASRTARLPRPERDVQPMIEVNTPCNFPLPLATNPVSALPEQHGLF